MIKGMTKVQAKWCAFSYCCRDIQLSNILLDDNYEVRLGSLSEACAQEGETLSRSSEQGKSGK